MNVTRITVATDADNEEAQTKQRAGGKPPFRTRRLLDLSLLILD
jgi:hypothetical protein